MSTPEPPRSWRTYSEKRQADRRAAARIRAERKQRAADALNYDQALAAWRQKRAVTLTLVVALGVVVVLPMWLSTSGLLDYVRAVLFTVGAAVGVYAVREALERSRPRRPQPRAIIGDHDVEPIYEPKPRHQAFTEKPEDLPPRII